MNSTELEKITLEVCDVAKQAGDFIKTNLLKVSSSDIQTKSQNSLVSYVDQEAERMIVARLQNLIPDAGFVTEEDTVDQSTSELYEWIIDPLDGTTNFLHKIPVFAVSIALRHKGEILSGVVYNIMVDECFYAWKNGGAKP